MIMDCLEILTVGLPFCAFKIITGSLFHQYWLIALGVIDLFINIANFIFLIFFQKRVIDACSFALLIRLLRNPSLAHKNKWQDLGNSIDVVLAFSLVAFIVGANHIKDLLPLQLQIWNICVVLNVLGAGLGRITYSIKNLKLQ